MQTLEWDLIWIKPFKLNQNPSPDLSPARYPNPQNLPYPNPRPTLNQANPQLYASQPSNQSANSACTRTPSTAHLRTLGTDRRTNAASPARQPLPRLRTCWSYNRSWRQLKKSVAWWRRLRVNKYVINQIISDICKFVTNECCHVGGLTFYDESDLATNDKFMRLRNWRTELNMKDYKLPELD